MYRKILVALENSRADKSLLPHVTELAKRLGSRLFLVHVADGWVARNFEQLKLTESQEMKDDRGYLDATAAKLRAEGLEVSAFLALGDPPSEILKTAEREQCDHDERAQVVDHGHGEKQQPHGRRDAAPQQGNHTEGEGDVGGHGDAPPR